MVFCRLWVISCWWVLRLFSWVLLGIVMCEVLFGSVVGMCL